MMKWFSWSLSLLLLLLMALPVHAEHVNIYSARNEGLIKPLLDQFTEATGIQVKMVTGDADALLKRLQFEGRNTPADVFLTVDVGRLHQARVRDLLQPIESTVLNESIPSSYRDPDGYWYGLSLRSRVIAYAPDRVAAEELGDYEDLADAHWRGRLCVRSSSNVYNQSLVASLIAHHGAIQTEAWARGLVDNFARSPQGGDRDQIKAVAIGQCDVALVNTYYIAGMLASGRQQEIEAAEAVTVYWPNQSNRGAHVNISGAAITRAARNKAAAIRLLEFMVSDQAQQWYAEANHEYPVRSDIRPSELLQSWGDFRADQLNLGMLGEYNAEAVRIMDRAGWR
jgi:iron(III) transport system substrate-binding protein